jgi:hypothetical protein
MPRDLHQIWQEATASTLDDMPSLSKQPERSADMDASLEGERELRDPKLKLCVRPTTATESYELAITMECLQILIEHATIPEFIAYLPKRG